MEQEDDYRDIRPYNDNEIQEVLNRIIRHPWALELIRRAKFPKLNTILFGLIKPFVVMNLQKQVRNIKTVHQFQKDIIVRIVLDRIRTSSTDGITVDGLENMEKGRGYLLISNHRDITLDPAYINYFLSLADLPITEIAFGDNLLINDLVSDLIRANRGFIVHRGLPPREQLKSSIRLSGYIASRLAEKQSVWIAQREGRAKNGDDRTNPAVLKMLYLCHRKTEVDYSGMASLYGIVPVSVSYEFDPCDRMKAWELYRTEHKGGHSKGKYEDLASMNAGIKGYKGRIHYHYGKPLSGEFTSEKDMAVALDRAIHRGYKLWPNNYIAYDILHNTDKYADKYTREDKEKIQNRLKRLPDKVRGYAWSAYARPVENREALPASE